MKKVIDKIEIALLWLMLIILIASILAFIIGIKPLCVMTGSMEPNLPTGSLIFVDTNAAYDELALKDVIVYKNEAKDFTIVHRVINITEEGIETKGDANKTSDGISTTEGNLIGRVIYFIPRLGSAIMFLRKPECLIIIIFCILSTLLSLVVPRKEKEAVIEAEI